jgi:hypothetical protein
MNPTTPQQQIELFHLIFLRHLGEKVDKLHYALKGGCNLRFYFKSIRYSEDIDLDVKVVAKDTLKTQVSKLLGSTAFHQVLKTRKISITDVNPVKQTDTTKRWKLKILGPASSLAIPTKIEFSRRGMDTGMRIAPIDPEVISAYYLYPILANHYELHAALYQKIDALIHRSESQARDVFDIHHLLGLGGKLDEISEELKASFHKATENTLAISFDDYNSQVVSYLKEEYRDYFGTKSKWNEMQENLINRFEK